MKNSGAEWIKEKIRLLVEASKKLVELGDVHYEGHAWSVVKLLLLGGWSYVYTTIVPKYFDKYWFVDLLAGPGTTKVEETGDVVAGSPFVAHFFARKPYKHYFLCDVKEKYIEKLKLLAKAVLNSPVTVMSADCNEYASTVVRRAEKNNAHFFAFLDNEGLDARWETVKHLLGAKCDILINFPTVGARRVLAAAIKTGDKRSVRALTGFFGDETWRDAQDGEDLLHRYLKKLRKGFWELRKKRPYVSRVRVGAEHYYYDVVLVCKHGPYVKAWEYLKEKLEWEDPKILRYALDLLMGRATCMDWFIDLQEEAERAAGEEGGQQTLERFLG